VPLDDNYSDDSNNTCLNISSSSTVSTSDVLKQVNFTNYIAQFNQKDLLNIIFKSNNIAIARLLIDLLIQILDIHFLLQDFSDIKLLLIFWMLNNYSYFRPLLVTSSR